MLLRVFWVSTGEPVEKDGKGETYLGYSVNVIPDSNHGLPLFAETRSASASDMIVLVPDLDACMGMRYRRHSISISACE